MSRSPRTTVAAALVAALSCSSLAAQAPIATHASPQGSEQRFNCGYSIALLSDLDDDGLRDLAVAMPWSATGANGWVDVRSSDTGATLFTIQLSTADAGGMSLAAIDDLDGDGYRDLIVGLPEYSVGGADRGIVELWSGRNGRRIRTVGVGATGDRFGTAVCAIGDADLDGVPDLAVGAPGYTLPNPSFGGPDAGIVTSYSGATNAVLETFAGFPGMLTGVSIAALGDLDGDGRPSIAFSRPGVDAVVIDEVLGTDTIAVNSTAGSNFGYAIASVGDLDGDGKRDLVVGQPEFSLPSQSAPGGRVAAFGSVSGAQLFSLIGASNDYLGADVADVGDCDLDGVADFVVSGWGFTPCCGAPPQGELRFVSGASGSVIASEANYGGVWSFASAEDAGGDGRADLWLASSWYGDFARRDDPTVAASASLTFTGPSGSRFGEALAWLDDLDGDGAPELLVGGPHAFPGDVADQGAARVYSGQQVLYAYDGALGEQLGAAVAALDDVDNDGTGDFAVGRPWAKFGNQRVGAVTVYSGATGAAVRSHFGVAWGDRFGAAIARVPDTDGDGVDDYAIGAPAVTPASGALGAGRVSLYSGATGAHRYTIDGTITNGGFGAALAGSDDVDGDGRGELLIGAPREWTTLFNLGVGRVHRRSGASGAVLDVLVGSQARMRFGTSLASVGDLDGDGAPEFVVGSPFYRAASDEDGRVDLRDGATGATLWSDVGALGSRLGSAVAAAGDLDNDGVPDFAVGEPRGVDLGLPGVPGRVRLYAGASQLWFDVLGGDEDGARFGRAVAGGADVDGDRRPDVAVGAPAAAVLYQPLPTLDRHATGAAVTWTARAVGSDAFGVGTAGCAGVHDLTLYRSVAPGQSLELRYSGMSPLTFPMLAFGAAMFPGGIPVLGALAHVDPQNVDGLPLPSGTHGAVLVPLPNDPALVGAFVHLQVFGLWLAGCPQLPFDLSSSNGLTVTVQ